MSDNNEEKDYFVPEQLEDNDFEKEKLEEKKLKKEGKVKSEISGDEESTVKTIDKKKIFNIIAVLLVISFIAFEVVWYAIYGKLWSFSLDSKKTSEPETVVEEFCSYFNDGNWKKVNSLMDFKGYYVLTEVLKEASYPKFDATYNSLEELDEAYPDYEEYIAEVTNVDEEALENLSSFKININEIQSCNKIQGTSTLYKIRVNFEYVMNGQKENITGIAYVSNASGKYKIVGGDWMEEILYSYEYIYMMQNGYNNYTNG